MMKLTKKSIDKATFQAKSFKGKPGRCVLWDETVPGLGVRIFPSGRKSFVLSYRARGRKRLMTLGPYGVLTLHQAREKARRVLVEVGGGEDPLTARRESEKAETVAELCATYIDRHARPHKKSFVDDERRIEQYIKPALGHLGIETVSREDVGKLHRKIGSRHPYEANRVLSLLSVMFNLAKDWGCAPPSFSNPANLPKRVKFKEKRRDRPVTTKELPKLLAAIDSEPNIYVTSALWLFLLTGLRKRELLDAKRDDVDFGRGTLRLADTKAGNPRHVPLSTAALEIFQNLPPAVGNPYFFPSPSKHGAPLSDLKRPWERIRTEAGCDGLRIHDLRHSVATWIADEGKAAQVIQGALGHQSIQTTMRYIHSGDRGPRQALEELGKRVKRAGSE